MAKFSRKLQVEKAEGKMWKLLKGFTFTYDDGTKVKVRKGFLTDFYSIPPVVKFLVDPNKKLPSVTHDYLYSIAYDRKKADLALKQGMKCLGVGWFKRATIYRSVRTFGWAFYDKKTKKVTK